MSEAELLNRCHTCFSPDCELYKPEPYGPDTCPFINSRKKYLCIPVAEAREFLTQIVESEGADTFEDATDILIKVVEKARALLAKLEEDR